LHAVPGHSPQADHGYRTLTSRARGHRFGGAARRLVFGLSTLGFVLLAIYMIASMFIERGYSPLGLFGAPVFVKDAGEGRAYFLTGQWRTFRTASKGTSTKQVTTYFYVDLWAVDAATAKPLWRKRVDAERGGGMSDRTLLGVDGGTLWLMIRSRLVAISAADGSVLAAAGQVESLNPELQGLMPMEDRYYVFDGRGLIIVAADARQWRIDPVTFTVSPAPPTGGVSAQAVPPVFYTPSGTSLHLVRGVQSPGNWLGLLTEEEAKSLEQYDNIGDAWDEVRRRLWSAQTEKNDKMFANQLDYTDLKPLTIPPDFLQPGLLREYQTGTQLPALTLADPESIVVVHRERLGEAGKLRLVRVATPDGNIVWESTLPLTVIQSVKDMGANLLLFGVEYIEGDPEIRDTLRDSPKRLVAVDWTTGTVKTFDFSALDTHPEAEKIDVGL
jgi:hypothetical protein